MAIAKSVREYLVSNGVKPDVVSHEHTATSLESAEKAHVSGHQLAKGIVLEADGERVLAVVPASDHVSVTSLRESHGKPLELAEEDALRGFFPDCEPGAVPAVGMAYGLATYVDERLFEQPEVYFEGGDHESLVHLNADEFSSLFGAAKVGRFGET